MPAPTTTAHTDTKARASLILGILSLVLSILAGIPAIILGHTSRARIRKSAGTLKGKGMALTGLLFGYLSVIIFPILLMVLVPHYIVFVRPPEKSHTQTASSNPLEEIVHAEATYHTTYPAQGYAPDLATLGSGPSGHAAMASAAFAGLLDDTMGKSECRGKTWCTIDDYKYLIQSDATEPHREYTITAMPVKSGKSFCATEDGVRRYDLTKEPLSEPYTHRQCSLLPPL